MIGTRLFPGVPSNLPNDPTAAQNRQECRELWSQDDGFGLGVGEGHDGGQLAIATFQLSE